MMGKIYTITELEQIIAPIARQHGVSRVYLFGSYARGEATEASDVDLCIDSGRIKSLFQLGGLYADLEDALEKPLDLVTTDGLRNNTSRVSNADFIRRLEEDRKLLYEEQ